MPEGDRDTLAAITSAAALCWAEIDRMGDPRSEIVQLGVKWVAAFMVSCVKNEESNIWKILIPSVVVNNNSLSEQIIKIF